MSAEHTTRLNRPWLLKMVAFFAVLVFFGFYGLYDATIAYPDRGRRHASYLEWQYLDTARSSRLLDKSFVSVPDPQAELQRLRTLERLRSTALDEPRKAWLEALSIVGDLRPDRTTINDPDARFKELNAEWTTSAGAKAAPKPLAVYDIPVQWLFVVIGLGGGLWMALHFINVARKRYAWDPATQTLTLPSGEKLTPADIEDFDKREWDKFLIFLKIKPSHPTLGGQELKLDLYQYSPLESWILEMERTAFPNRASDDPKPDPGAPPADSTSPDPTPA